ncbi:hypothetical protein B0J11DRAFT_517565, partial [Dendryphion nanum]
MAAILNLFGGSSNKTPPPPVQSDDIYPLHLLDDTKTYRGIVVAWTLRFNDVLDPEKLHGSLSRLLEIGDWRKLGGRVRLNDKGKLELHVPTPFTADRPAVFYTHQHHSLNIEDHPLAKDFPKPTTNPSVHPSPDTFRAFAAREDAPSTVEDLLYKDTPQLSLHITSFNNATLVGLSWPHTLMDVMGQYGLMLGWSLVLAGKESEVPPMLGAREDVLAAAIEASSEKEGEEYRLQSKQMSVWTLIRFGLRMAWDGMFTSPSEPRTIFLPQKMVADLQNQARADLAEVKGGLEDVPFVSEGDVLTAWMMRLVATSLPQPRPVTALHALNARFRIPSIAQSGGIYVQNMAVAAFTFLSPETATGSMGSIALENRNHLVEQSAEDQVLAGLRHTYKTGSNAVFMCGPPDAVLMPFTNWTRANVFKTVDFSPAVVQAGETGQSRSNAPGTIVFHQAFSLEINRSARNVIVILGKDQNGNYWINPIVSPQAWVKIEEALKAY